jgi:hypothetical protein
LQLAEKTFLRNAVIHLVFAAATLHICACRQQRKEVIQCLIPSAVTSLGSPDSFHLKLWRLSARTSEFEGKAHRELPVRLSASATFSD